MRLGYTKAGPLGTGNAARRRVRRVVRVGMLRHDGEVEDVVVKDDAVLVLGIRGRARYAQALKRMSQIDKATILRTPPPLRQTPSYSLV